jgi:hypothetical protein
MTEQRRKGDRVQSPKQSTDQPSTQQEDHRLRGDESAKDFEDAERDSCAATRHRDGLESDS